MVLGLAAASWLIYKLLLKEISAQRHQNLHRLFANLAVHTGTWILMAVAFLSLQAIDQPSGAVERLEAYLGFALIISCGIVFVKTCRILLFEYLFLGHMRAGVPVLLVNLFSLLLSIILGVWVVTEIFDIKLAPLLATSAIFSLVLGLALQDTLGNLFAGIALQLDKPYEIGDWIEIQNNGRKLVGQVLEISWRATVLIGLSEESITLPNRLMSQAEVSNFSTKTRAVIRSQIFRVTYGADLALAKQSLLEAARSVPVTLSNPSPLALIFETTESWIAIKLIYFIENYGSQFVVADQIFQKGLEALDKAGIATAGPRIFVAMDRAESNPA